MKNFLISEEQRQELLKYMWTRPYGEVYRLMEVLLKLQERKDERVEEPSKKKV
jgi:hypothetical protein